MPQTTPERRARWWPDSDTTGTDTAEQYLKDRGWLLTRDWFWLAPGGKSYKPSETELDAIQYLIEEWDYGGIKEIWS